MAYISSMKLPDNVTYDLKDARVAVPVPADAVFTDHIFSGLAEDVDYDNTASGLTSTNVQDALDEIADGGGGGSTGCVELTQAEYDALSREEKNADVIYLITDSPDNYLDEVFGDFASVEYTSTASKAYAVGDYLVYNSKFYKVTSAIAQGGTITVGTNVTRTTVGDEIDVLKDALIVNNASGSIASFPDGGDGFAVRDLKVQMEPIQDLHGQANPYPAGGGVNQWDEEWEVGTIDIATGSNVDGNSNIRSKNYIPSIPNTSYYFNRANIAGNIFEYDENKNFIKVTSSPTIFTTSNTTHYLRFYIGSAYGTVYNHDISINYPSTDTAYHPYANICPISGRTGVTVWDDPKHSGLVNWNQLAESGTDTSAHYTEGWASTVEKQDGTITATTTRDYTEMGFNFVETDVLIVSGHKYYTAMNIESAPSGTNTVMLIIATNWTNAASQSVSFTGAKTYSAVLTADKDGVSGQNQRLMIRANKASDIPSGSKLVISKAMWVDLTEVFGAGNEPTAEEFEALFPKNYYPYNTGETTCVSAVNGDPYRNISISWQTQVGTVYGGTLDVTQGVLTVDRALVGLGDLTWTSTSRTGRFTANLTTNIVPASGGWDIPNVACSIYKVASPNAVYSLTADKSISSYGATMLQAYDSGFSDATAFKTSLSGQTVVVEIAQPVTIQLTAQQMTTLLGQNNVWSDADSVSVDYIADTKLYIAKFGSADDVSYDNTDSGLSATDVQDAIDELADEKYEKPSGGIPASDLASAVQASLAKINIQTLDSGQDLNNYYDNGFYYIKTNVAHSPQDWAWLLVIGGVGTAQICFTVSKIFVRAYTGSPITWTDWRYASLQQVQ